MTLPKFSSKAFLAPMAGISDPACRLLCKEMGAGLVVTELTSIHGIIAKERQLSERQEPITNFIEYSDKERPVSVQLFGHDVDAAVKAAKIVEPFFDIIDFNMGCPAPHITNQMAGAALLEKPEHVEKLFSALVKAVDKPVTLKVRSGIDDDSCYLYKPIAKIAENCGVQMITLHARSLRQGYSGKANWDLIKELKESVNIPVVGNGDIFKPEDAERMITETGCDYVMIGRGAMGNPYIFKQVNDYFEKEAYTKLSDAERLSYFFTYLEYTKRFNISFAQIKVQAMEFTRGIQGGVRLRQGINHVQNLDEMKELFEKFLIKEN
jgi:tRNA-dihydrouridine synthase B